MATIQLDQEFLAVESHIDTRNQEAATRELGALPERYRRRPEYRYLQALFDLTFEIRAIEEILADVAMLVTDMPDFSEAVALLAVLYHRVGDGDRAEVFAREAAHARNPAAQRRARAVLGGRPTNPPPGQEPFSRRSSNKMRAVQGTVDTQPGMHAAGGPVDAVRPPPVVVPAAHLDQGSASSTMPGPPRKATQQMVSPWPPTAIPIATSRGDSPTPPKERITLDGHQAPLRVPTPGGGALTPPPITTPRPHIAADETPIPSSDDDDVAWPGDEGAASETPETIEFSPVEGSVPPPPTIPPEAPDEKRGDVAIPAPGHTGFSQQIRRAETAPEGRGGEEEDSGPPPPLEPGENLGRRRPSSLPPELAVDRTGVDRRKIPTHPSRPAIAIAPSPDAQRHWFRYARENQLEARGGVQQSTALMLVDLAERVMDGNTPLSDEPIPLDRRGLILAEQRLESYRRAGRSSIPGSERAAVTAAAAFLLALLLRECDGRAVDTSAEDGACKVVVPSGATVRPLLVAAAYSRARGPGLVETFDRAATSHMRRGPSVGAGPRMSSSPDTAPGMSTVSVSELSVIRRDLDAGTICVCSALPSRAPAPNVDFRAVAMDYWASPSGRAIAGASRRVGLLALDDIDALERHAIKTFGVAGQAPPGTAWPWSPPEDLEEVIFTWGAIVGEVLNGIYGGRWEADPGNSEDRLLWRVVLAGGVIAWPMTQVFLRLGRGVAHDLTFYVDAVGRVVGRQALSSSAPS